MNTPNLIAHLQKHFPDDPAVGSLTTDAIRSIARNYREGRLHCNDDVSLMQLAAQQQSLPPKERDIVVGSS